MSKGIVYILTNPCLDGWVKIGMTERQDVDKRLKELNTPSNIPLSYRCYATYEVENPELVEKTIHSLIDMVDNSLHAREYLSNGKVREREFFKISPETAYGIFKNVAILRGDKECLKLTVLTLEQEEEESANTKSQRSNNSFKLLNIPVGTKISFLLDDTIVAKVVDDKNHIEYDGVQYTPTGLAKKLLVELEGWAESSIVNGWKYFVIGGITLFDLREQIERVNANSEEE